MRRSKRVVEAEKRLLEWVEGHPSPGCRGGGHWRRVSVSPVPGRSGWAVGVVECRRPRVGGTPGCGFSERQVLFEGRVVATFGRSYGVGYLKPPGLGDVFPGVVDRSLFFEEGDVVDSEMVARVADVLARRNVKW